MIIRPPQFLPLVRTRQRNVLLWRVQVAMTRRGSTCIWSLRRKIAAVAVRAASRAPRSLMRGFAQAPPEVNVNATARTNPLVVSIKTRFLEGAYRIRLSSWRVSWSRIYRNPQSSRTPLYGLSTNLVPTVSV
ncbi:MAG: hypothetical protein QOG97_1488 [Acidimicrobiaceae bacterium]|jgi:hypothetical protein|nr:hypothetical protein [Acidimicrobiaceae bacterium]